MTKGEQGCGPWIVTLITIPLNVALRGYTLCLLWGWFMVPLGVTPIGLWHACGLSVLMFLFTFKYPKKDPEDEKKDAWTKALEPVIVSALTSLITAGLGFVYHALM